MPWISHWLEYPFKCNSCNTNSSKLNHYLELWSLRCADNIISTSRDGWTDSHTCANVQSLPRPTTVARFNITQHVQERQRPMSLRSAQQLVYCCIFSHIEVLPQGIKNMIVQPQRVYRPNAVHSHCASYIAIFDLVLCFFLHNQAYVIRTLL